MDKATECLLLHEARIEQVRNSLKVILPNIKSSFLKPNKGKIKTIIKKLPQKELKHIERDAIRQIPGFKKDYLDAQRKVLKLKLHPYMNKPTAAATALVSATSDKSVDEVLKVGHMASRNAKLTSLIPGAQFLPLIKFGLFVVAVTYLLSGLDLALPAWKLTGKSLLLLLSMAGKALALFFGIGSEPGAGAAEKFFPTLSDTPLGDIPLDKFVQSAGSLTKFVPEA